jgi:hypothetical protein
MLERTKFKDTQMTTTDIAVDVAQAPATSAKPRIHWAEAPGTFKKVELEEKLEAMRSRNWITERMIEQSQRHWNCSREEAIERLLAQTSS